MIKPDSTFDPIAVLNRIVYSRSLLSSSVTLLLVLIVLVEPAAAQMGGVYCGTNVETGIDLVFGALIGLGLPFGMFSVGKSGLKYMRAEGNPEQQNAARKDLIMSGVGFGILIAAIISPEILSKVGSEMGFAFSDCVKPLS